MTGSAGQQRVPVSYVVDYKIPLPPLDVQRQIVAELDGYRKVIDGARQVISDTEQTIQARLAEIWGEVVEAKSSA